MVVSHSRLCVLSIAAAIGWGCSTHWLQKQEALLQKALKQCGSTFHLLLFPSSEAGIVCSALRYAFCAFRRVDPGQDCCPPKRAFVLCGIRESRRKYDSFPCSPVFDASSMLRTNDMCAFLSCPSFSAACKGTCTAIFFHRRLGNRSWVRSFFFCFHVTALSSNLLFSEYGKPLKVSKR